MFLTSQTDRVDWKIIEKHYSQYSPEALEAMTYPKKRPRYSPTGLSAVWPFETKHD